MPTTFEAVTGVVNACQPLPRLITGGQPTAQQLEQYRQAGGQVVLDIRDPMEPRPFDEPALAQSLGLEYVNVTVATGSLTAETMDQILAVLRENQAKEVLFHCASGNRVGAALIPYFVLDHGMDEQDAVDQAMRVGLRSVELMEWGLDYLRQRGG